MQVDHAAQRAIEPPHDLRSGLQEDAILAAALQFDRSIQSPVVGVRSDDVPRLKRHRVALSLSLEDVPADSPQFVGVDEASPGFDQPGFLGTETPRRLGRHGNSLPSIGG
jgi:hypothetical protein